MSAIATMPFTVDHMPDVYARPYAMSEAATGVGVGFARSLRERREAGGVGHDDAYVWPLIPGISEDDPVFDREDRVFIQVYDPTASGRSLYADTGAIKAKFTNARGKTLRLNRMEDYPESTLEVPVDPSEGFASTLSSIHVRRGADEDTGCVATTTVLEGDICRCPGWLANRDGCKVDAAGFTDVCYGNVTYCADNAANVRCYGIVLDTCAIARENGFAGNAKCYRPVGVRGAGQCAKALNGGIVNNVDCYDLARHDCVNASQGTVRRVRCRGRVRRNCVRTGYGTVDDIRCCDAVDGGCVGGAGNVPSGVDCPCEEEDMCPTTPPVTEEEEYPCCYKGLVVFTDLSCGKLDDYDETSLPPICAENVLETPSGPFCNGPVVMPTRILGSYDLRIAPCTEPPTTTEEATTATPSPITTEEAMTVTPSPITEEEMMTVVPFPDTENQTDVEQVDEPGGVPFSVVWGSVASVGFLCLLVISAIVASCMCRKRCGKKGEYSVNPPAPVGGEVWKDTMYGRPCGVAVVSDVPGEGADLRGSVSDSRSGDRSESVALRLQPRGPLAYEDDGTEMGSFHESIFDDGPGGARPGYGRHVPPTYFYGEGAIPEDEEIALEHGQADPMAGVSRAPYQWLQHGARSCATLPGMHRSGEQGVRSGCAPVSMWVGELPPMINRSASCTRV
ncbi:MAG: hypothetical protein OXF02_03045 [Simkaniaceae bacterium]|nr:hypothetical protein [Simkaniaceae bacterium]